MTNTNHTLYKDLAQIIEQGKRQVVSQVNSVLTLTYWHVGYKINDHILKHERAEYGMQTVNTLATLLEKQY